MTSPSEASTPQTISDTGGAGAAASGRAQSAWTFWLSPPPRAPLRVAGALGWVTMVYVALRFAGQREVPYLSALLPRDYPLGSDALVAALVGACFAFLAWLLSSHRATRIDGVNGTLRTWLVSPPLPGKRRAVSEFVGISEREVRYRGRGPKVIVHELQLIERSGARVVLSRNPAAAEHAADVAILQRLTGLPVGADVRVATGEGAAARIEERLSAERRAATALLPVIGISLLAALFFVPRVDGPPVPLYEFLPEHLVRALLGTVSPRYLSLALGIVCAVRIAPSTARALLDASSASRIAPLRDGGAKRAGRDDLLAVLAVVAPLYAIWAGTSTRREAAEQLQAQGVSWADALMPRATERDAPTSPPAPPTPSPAATPSWEAPSPTPPREPPRDAPVETAPATADAGVTGAVGAPPLVPGQVERQRFDGGRDQWTCHAGTHHFRGVDLAQWEVFVVGDCDLTCEDCTFQLDGGVAATAVHVGERGQLTMLRGIVRSEGIGLSVGGRSALALRGTEVERSSTAVFATDRARVEVDGGRLQGSPSISAGERSRVSVRNASVRGGALTFDRARVRDEGGNSGLNVERVR